MMSFRTLVACIGNSLIADDALGCVVYDRLKEVRLPEGVRVESLELGGMRLLDILDGEDFLLVVDAVQFGTEPGTVHVLDWQELPEVAGLPVTSHDIGFREAIMVGYKLFPERMPDRIVLIGVEGACFDMCGVQMTPEVRGAVENVLERVIGEVESVFESSTRSMGPERVSA